MKVNQERKDMYISNIKVIKNKKAILKYFYSKSSSKLFSFVLYQDPLNIRTHKKILLKNFKLHFHVFTMNISIIILSN